VPVRSQSTLTNGAEGCARNWDYTEKLRSVQFFRSPLVWRVAANRCKHFPSRRHAIPADCMSVELKCQLNVAVAKQRLHGFWICSNTNEKRRETCGADYESRIVAGRRRPAFLGRPGETKESQP
jgi:hypothetical protein